MNYMKDLNKFERGCIDISLATSAVYALICAGYLVYSIGGSIKSSIDKKKAEQKAEPEDVEIIELPKRPTKKDSKIQVIRK